MKNNYLYIFIIGGGGGECVGSFLKNCRKFNHFILNCKIFYVAPSRSVKIFIWHKLELLLLKVLLSKKNYMHILSIR